MYLTMLVLMVFRLISHWKVAKETGAGPDNVIGDHKIHAIEDDAREANEQDDSKMKNSGCSLLPENCKGSRWQW